MLLVCVTMVPTSFAQLTGTKSLKAVKVLKSPVIDGKVAPGEWPVNAVVSQFTDIQTNKLAVEQTEAFLAYDETFVYIAFRGTDTQPDGIIGRETLRDSRYSGGEFERNDSEDYVEVIFDTFRSAKKMISVNSLSIQSELEAQKAVGEELAKQSGMVIGMPKRHGR